MKQAAKLIALVGALGLAGAALAGPASAQDAPPATVVIVHGLRGFTADLYLDGKLLINTFQPERSTDPLPVPPGPHVVEIRQAGAASDTPAAVVANIDLAAGTRYDAVAHLSPEGTPTVTLYVDDISAVPPGQARAVVRHAAAAPPIDVRFGAAVVGAGLTNGSEAGSVLPAGTYELGVAAAGATDPLTPPQDVVLPEGTATFMYLIGSADAKTLDWLAVQTAGLQSAPTKVPTGDGSVTQSTPTASNGTGRDAIGLIAVAIFFAVATVWRLRRAA